MTHVGSEDPDPLGDEVKRFEDIEAGRKMMPGLPVCARLDGRAFHTFTRGCLRPSDPGMAGAMARSRCRNRAMAKRVSTSLTAGVTNVRGIGLPRIKSSKKLVRAPGSA